MVAQVQVEPTQETAFNAFGKIQNGMSVKLKAIEAELTSAESQVQDCIGQGDFRGMLRGLMDYSHAMGERKAILEQWTVLFGQGHQKAIMADSANEFRLLRSVFQQVEIKAKEKS